MGTLDEGTIETTAVSLRAVGAHAPSERFDLLASGGIHAWYQEEKELFGGTPESSSDGGVDPLFGVGAQAKQGKGFALRLEWTRFFGLATGDMDNAALSLLNHL